MLPTPQQSLLEYQGGSVFESTIGWINNVLLGELSVMLSVIAVAIFGFVLLTGRLNLRHGGRVVLGIFILLGAPVIASAFATTWGGYAEASPQVVFEAPPTQVSPRQLPPANYDPYAGASLRPD